MLITNNIDFYTYLTNRGVICMYYHHPTVTFEDDLVVIFANNYHAMSVCGNGCLNEKEFEKEAKELLRWFKCCNNVIMISNVIKFGTPYMAENYKTLQLKYDSLGIVKQNLNTKDIGELIVPHRIQIRYRNVKPIKFDFVRTNNIKDPKYVWSDKYGNVKHQQMHYINCINRSHDTETRRKLRYLPEYTVFSQLYKHLKL